MKLLALFLLLFLLSPSVSAATPTAPKIQITIDDTAVRQLVALIETKDASDASVDRWLELPANRFVLTVGAREGNLTREKLKANVVAAINGTATRESQPPDDIGAVRLAPVGDYKRMLDELKATVAERIARIAARVGAFSPAGTNVTETVYLHVGGDWDALNEKGSVYVNVRFWHDNFRPSWDGFNMIVAHETLHTVQNASYGNPEAQDTGAGAWLTALSKIQREGTARYLETETDPTPYAPYTYGFFYRAVDAERLRAFPADAALLQPLAAACFPVFDKPRFFTAYTSGINAGGPFYDLGHGVAKAIDEKLGRAALIETVTRGPKDFWMKYVTLAEKDAALPKLPPSAVTQIRAMQAKL